MSASLGSVAINPPGCVGLPLHAPGFAGPGYYLNNQARPHPHKLNWALLLDDVEPDDGGFALIPGSRASLSAITA